jgi:hypothetical protein
MEPYQGRSCGDTKQSPQDMSHHHVHRFIVTTFKPSSIVNY